MAKVAAEVIELISDEETEDSKKDDKQKKTCNANCINFQCNSGVNMKIAPTFACTFFGANTAKKKKRLICEKCLNDSIQHQQVLVNSFLDRKPLLKCEFPDHTMEVEISDSDDSDTESKTDDNDDNFLPEEFLLDLEQKLDVSLASISSKYDIKFQVEEAQKCLTKQWDNIQIDNDKVDGEIKDLMGKLDKLRNSLYDEFKPSIKMMEELTICDGVPDNNQFPLVATKKVTQIRNTPTVPVPDNQPIILEEIERDNVKAAADLPPLGLLVKPVPDVDTPVLIMKHALIPWLKAKVIAVVNKNPTQYKVKLNAKKHNQAMKIVSGKQVAIAQQSNVIIPVSTRVVALFQDVNTNNFYSGVIAEPPKSTNKYRYLVFFDDGYAQYVIHKNIYLVSESSPQVWEDVPSPSRDFVKKYMESYPERPMVKLQTGQVVKTEWNGKWWIARVIQVDASLVQMHFDADNRTEWIYRGSARLGPLYVELLKANARQQGNHATANAPARHRLPLSSNKQGMPYVEYTSSTDQDEFLNRKVDTKQMSAPIANAIRSIDKITHETPFVAPQQSRAVAKKSTAKKPVIPEPAYNPPTETKPSHSIVYYQTQNRTSPKRYTPHRCAPKCLDGCSFTPEDLKGYSPLSIPLLCGWNRQLCKFSKGKKVTIYQSPCGKRLRNMEELHKYLRVTGSPMSVDLFEFDHWVHCLAEFVLDKCFVNIKDLSYGAENVPIPCVNEIDHALPDTIRYSTQREPTEDVHLNLDSDFLCCCDCTDDCQDKEKCQCWQLTNQGATLGGRVANNAVGYIYKRLPEPVTTGIYECNSRCKCSVKTCLNRVVQHPLTLKLQVFKTAPRGWGIRCLNDIPQGSFICIYAGRLLTEQGANEGGKNYGDEYLAELDYVEVVEGIKEGYEADVLDPEMEELSNDTSRKDNISDEDDTSKPSGYESDEDFDITKYRDDPNLRIKDIGEDTPIRKRLRKRKRGEKSKDEEADEEKTKSSKSKSEMKSSRPDLDKSESRDSNYDTITLSDEDESKRREPGKLDLTVEAQIDRPNFKSVRDFFGEDEAVYIMDAKTTGNIGRYLNHSCDPNVFVQNVFVDTHDVRFPWVAFFALHYIRAGQELTWNYSYDVGSIPGKMIICKCGSSNCRGRLL